MLSAIKTSIIPDLAVQTLHNASREQGGNLLNILRHQIRRLKYHVVHIVASFQDGLFIVLADKMVLHLI